MTAKWLNVSLIAYYLVIAAAYFACREPIRGLYFVGCALLTTCVLLM